MCQLCVLVGKMTQEECDQERDKFKETIARAEMLEQHILETLKDDEPDLILNVLANSLMISAIKTKASVFPLFESLKNIYTIQVSLHAQRESSNTTEEIKDGETKEKHTLNSCTHGFKIQ